MKKKTIIIILFILIVFIITVISVSVYLVDFLKGVEEEEEDGENGKEGNGGQEGKEKDGGKEDREEDCDECLGETNAMEATVQTVKIANNGTIGTIWLKTWSGGFGNHMHQFAYCATYAEKYNLCILLPSNWCGTYFFEPFRMCPNKKNTTDSSLEILLKKIPIGKETEIKTTLEQYYKGKSNIELKNQYWLSQGDNRNSDTYDDDESIKKQGRTRVIVDSLFAYNSFNFSGMSATFLRERVFCWSPRVKALEIYKKWYDRRGTYDAAHIRRGDSISAHWFIQISIASYKKAYQKYNVDEKNLIVISDNKELRRNYKSSWTEHGWLLEKNSSFYVQAGEKYFKHYCWNGLADGLEDFLILYFARTIFRANSSFSWWAACISPTATVYSPLIDNILIQENVGKKDEYDVEFIKGNAPHWFAGFKPLMLVPP